MNKKKLKRCPFCKEKPSTRPYDLTGPHYVYDESDNAYFVQCSCGVSHRMMPTEELATREWNTRKNKSELELTQEEQDECIDELMILTAHDKMSIKMRKKRKQGRYGWNTKECTIDSLKESLIEHLNKGDIVDVLNYAGMILFKETWVDQNARTFKIT